MNINSKEFIKTKIINFEELKLNSKLPKKLKINGSLIMYTLCVISLLSNFFFKKDYFGFSNTEIHLSDINKYVEFNWINGLRR